MKHTLTIWIIILFIITGYGGCKQSGSQSDELIIVDVTASYPKKELILQDFMDVEYIPLETTDEFITQGLLLDVGKKFVIVKNRTNDGNIFIFDRTGKGQRKINRKGQGGEEYMNYLRVCLDEDKDEIFVNDYLSQKIMVYDLEGNFKRSFQHKEGLMYGDVYNFNRENLICHDFINDNHTSLTPINAGQSFMIISKQDGSITKEIQIPFKEKKSTVVKVKDESSGMTYAYNPSTVHPLAPFFDSWILVDVSADTLYRYSPDYTMQPFVARTPSIQSMNPEEFLFVSLFTDRYYFMEAVKKDLSSGEFPGTDLLYDKQEKALFRYTVYNDDYSNKEKAFLKSRPVNNEIPCRQILEAPDLVKAYEKGQLKGQLKEIAAGLNEESNPVIMLLKHKK
jgi:hypothetical protein